MKLAHPFIVVVTCGVAILAVAWWTTQERPVNREGEQDAAATRNVAAGVPMATDPPASSAIAQVPPVPADPDSAVKAVISQHLRDPDSAKFQNIRYRSKTEVCGEVNARNGLGGYTGFSTFWVQGLGDARPIVLIDTVDTTFARTACRA